jgi:hypothetical protein
MDSRGIVGFSLSDRDFFLYHTLKEFNELQVVAKVWEQCKKYRKIKVEKDLKMQAGGNKAREMKCSLH